MGFAGIITLLILGIILILLQISVLDDIAVDR
jgi:hypothetical protein